MNSVKFLNGAQMPIVGLGTGQMADEKEMENALDTALEAGYRHIDTAYLYDNEALIRKVLRKWLDSGKVTREELFIVTKLPLHGMSSEKVSHFLKQSLENLQLSYVNLCLIHSPVGLTYIADDNKFSMKDGKPQIDFSTDLEAVWRAMEAELEAGRVKSLGVSNCNAEQVRRICSFARYKPMNNQVELSVYVQQKSLRDECQKLGVTLCAYAPLGSYGRKVCYGKFGKDFEVNGLLEDSVVLKIAKMKGKNPWSEFVEIPHPTRNRCDTKKLKCNKD